MKKIIVFVAAIMISFIINAQSIVFQENFETSSVGLTTSADSAGFPTTNFQTWAASTNLYKSGAKSDSNVLQSGKTIYLTTNSFSTIANNFVILEFSQICKLFFSDGGSIDVSIDGGINWIPLSNAEYKGSGILFTSGGNSKFSDNSYSIWSAGNNTIPVNSWWKNEKFDISALAANKSNVKIRFKYTSTGQTSGAGRYGWLLDDIKVTASPSEMNPPQITMISYPTDTAYFAGPYNISAYVKDPSGIDTVYVSYKVGNGGFLQIGMQKSATIDSLYTAGIPYVGFGKIVNFNVIAKDASSSHNLAYNPGSGYYSFYTKYSSGGNVIVGTGTSTQNYPFKANADSTKSASIYLASAINRFGLITQLQWNVSTAQSATIPIKIYIKKTNAISLSGDSWINLINGATLVYDGSQTFSSTGWKTIALTTPFNYNSGNLIVMCEANYGGVAGAGATPSFYYTSGSTGTHQYFASSTSIVTVNAQRPNIAFGFVVLPLPTPDAGISQITNPSASVTAGTAFDINVKIKNYSNSPLTKTKVYYTIDGNTAVLSNWTGSLLKDSTTIFTAGNLTLLVGIHALKIWTDLPNDSADQNNINDTVNYSFYACSGPLNGIYTIGGSGANFASFTEAYTGLTQCGVSSAVVFKVNPGTYSEQLTIPEIAGASAVNTITFQAANNDSNSVIMNHTSSSSSNWIVKLNTADYICFKNIKFAPSDSVNSISVVMTNGATNNKFIGNLFSGYNGIATAQTHISIEGTANPSSGNLIQGNYFQKAAYAISVKGIAAIRLKKTVICNNIIDNPVVYGIFAQYVDSTLIDSNTIFSSNVNANKYGIYLQFGDILNTITKNKISLSSGVTMYGMLIESCISTDAGKGLLANNFVSILNGSAAAYGIRLNTTTKYKIYANSVVCNGSSSSNTKSLNITSSSSGIDIKNNNLYSNKYPYYIEGSSAVNASDYNNLYSTSSILANWNAIDCPNLAALITASLKDSNSISVDPNFNSFSDLHTFSFLLKGKGIMLTDVSIDIDGNPRLNPPCIGADEFLPSTNDASLTAFIQPIAGCGLTSSEKVSVVIKNVGITSITSGSCSASFKISGSIAVNPEIINRSIAPGDTIHYTFNATANLSVASTHIDSTYKLIAWNMLNGDFAHSNDTASVTVLSSYLPASPVPCPNLSIPYATTALLTATSTDTLQWFNVPTGGANLATGTPFLTPVLLDTTTYYVQSRAIGSRINYALNAYVTNGSGGGFGYTPDLYNDGIIPAYGTAGPGVAGYTSSNSWIQLDWWYPVSFKKLVFYKDTRPMTSCTFQYWDGSSFVDFYSYNNSNVNDSIVFPLITTMKLRFNNIAGASANPNFREIEVYANDGNANSGCASSRVPITVFTTVSPKEAGISSIIAPTGCSLYQVPVSVKVFNHGSLPMNAANTTLSYKIDNGSFITPEALNVTILPFDTVQYTFNALANFSAPTVDRYIKITAVVNTTSDAMHSNDTLVKDSVSSRYTPPSPTASNVNIANGISTTLNATAISGSINWFNNLSGGNIIGQGNSFTTPVLYSSDTFYIEAKAYYSSLVTVGTGTAANATTSYPAPYGSRFIGAKHQMLITRTELNALGIEAGPITSLAFDVDVIGGLPLQNFQIKMGHTNLNALSIGSWVANMTTVYTSFLFTDVPGWNTHNFTTPFVWNGIDNVVAEVCFDNSTLYGSNASMRFTPTTFNSVALSYWGQAGVCSSAVSNEIYMNRPNMRINGTTPGCSSAPRIPVIVNVALPPQNDAGVTALVNPVGSTPAGIPTPIKVKIKNWGQANLSSVAIAWTLNNVAKPVFNFTGTLASGAETTVTIGNENLSGGYYCIKAWTQHPNGVAIDSTSSNDTLATTCFSACMNGTYTIGSTSGGIYPNFTSFTAAITNLQNSGVCGNIIFLVDSGTYTEQVRIPQIMGASASSTITFRSASNESAKVILQYKALGQNNSHTLKLDSADYVRIEKMTIKALDSTYGNVVELDNGATNNIISNNSIEMPDNSSPYYNGIYDHNGGDYYNKYLNNKVINGYNGLYSTSGSSTIVSKGTEIRGNKLLNFKYYGIFVSYTDSVMITGNELISSGLLGNATYALYSSSNNNAIQIIGNKITLTSPGHQFGLYMYNNNATASAHGLIANNMVALSGGSSTSSIYGLYPTSSSYQDFLYNSISVAVPSNTNSRALNLFGSTFINLKNNIFVNTGGGFAYYVQSPAAIVQSEYNDIYTSGAILGYWNGNIANLLDLQTASTKNANSVSVNPGFASSTDLHLVSTSVSALGTPISTVPNDIDGNIRDAVHPCLGAHEVPLLQHDAGVSFISSPNAVETEGASVPVKVAVRNYGTSPITSMTVSYVLNNAAPVNFAYTGSIPYLGVDTVTFPVNITVTAGNNTLCAYTTLSGDINTFNNQSCKNYFSSPIYDAKLASITPIQEGCNLTTDSVKILIVNNGIMPISGGLTVNYQILGGAVTVTEIVNTTIPVGGNYLHTFNTAVNLAVTTSDSIYKIKAWVSLINDNIHTNDIDTLKVHSLFTPANPVSVSNVNIPYATATSLSATSPNNAPLKWYDVPVGGTSIFTGSPYTTSMLFASDTLYVEANTTNPFNHIVGTGPNTAGEPFSTLNGFTTSVSIYNAAEIGGFGFINQLSWDAFAASTPNIPVKIYMKQTTLSVMTPDTLTNLLNGATLVYDGSKIFDAAGWNAINFISPFLYLSDNLMVICQASYGGTGVYPSAIFRQTSNPGSKFHQVFKADNAPPTGLGVIYASRPNIKISGYNAGCPSQRVAAIITVSPQPAFDAGVTSILTPVTGVNLSNHDTVKVMVRNYGYSSIYNFAVKYKLDNNAVVSEIMTDTITSGSSKLFTFAQTVDLSSYIQPRTFNLITWTDLTGDPTHQNDSIKKIVINNGPVYCFSSATLTNDDDIGNVKFAGINNGNPLPVENNPTAYQKYNNYTALPPAVVHQGSVYPISLSVIFSAYSYNGVVNVYIDFNKNGSWDTPEELVFSGNYNGSSNSTINGYITVPYNATPGFCRMRVVADEQGVAPPCGSYAYGETEDYTVQIIPPLPHDGGISKIRAPKFLPYNATSLQPADFFIRNYGSDILNNAMINYKVNNAAIASQLWVGNILQFAEDSITKNLTINTGMNRITAYTTGITADSNQYNDTNYTTIFKEYKTTPPYFDNFETNKYWFPTDTVNGATINNLWAQGVPSSSYPSLNAAHSPVNAWVTQLSGSYPINNISVLYSPVFDISVMKADTLKFWHWREFSYGTSAVIEYKNANGFWTNLGIQNDTNATNWYNYTSNNWIGSDTNWTQSTYKIKNLNNLGSTVQFRFVFTSDVTSNAKRGWAIDDFELTLAPISGDAGVIAITSPATTSLVGDNVSVTVTVKNFGATTISNIPVKYQITGSGIQTGTLNGPIAPGATANYTFPQSFTVGNIQSYYLCAYTTLSGDTYTQNDSSCKQIIVNPAANDVGISDILQPASAANPGNLAVKVVIKNFGTITQTSIPLSYRRATTAAVNEIWTGSLASGATTEYTFTTLTNVPSGNAFSFCAYTNLANDAYIHNDSICKSVLISNGINNADEAGFWLGQNMPNPTTGITNIEYSLPNDGEVEFEIINLYGQKVYSFNKKIPAGKHLIDLNLNDFSAGIYYYTIEFKDKRLVKKMLLNR